MKSEFTPKLLDWNKRFNVREMPWKGERDPYRIWLSEIILQQTRVEQGWSYYEKFLQAFPRIEDLAEADDAAVFKLWEGLGYYSRCRNLLATAREIVGERKGRFPQTFDEILQLKGVGPYTAAAIASFAFNEPKAVVDGNVQRVLARYFGIRKPIDSTEGKKEFARLAQSLIDKKSPASYNQAIMDFGAVCCKPQLPLCQDCIFNNSCVAYEKGLVNSLPVKAKAVPRKERWFYYFIVHYKGAYYVRNRKSRDIWQHLHEFVLLESAAPIPEPVRQWEFVRKSFGRNPDIREISPVREQALTHRSIKGQFIRVELNKPLKEPGDYELVEESRLAHLAFPRFISRYLEENFFQ